MHRHHVESSVFRNIGYDQEARILEVEFKDTGDVWQYYAFPPRAYKKFINSESLGHFFTKYIKNKYHEIQML
ncbi:MAG TPA: KTSC domain-containing protein [Mucilaginibacter sp.]